MRVNDLFKFIRARHCVYLMREAGNRKPWTDDPILQKYRFCNVYRELDAVTVWIRENWREPNKASKDLWFAMVVARLFNNPDTLYDIGYPGDFTERKKLIYSILKTRESSGLRVFNPAYIVSTNGLAMNKVDYIIDKVLTPMWKAPRPLYDGTLGTLFEQLMRFQGMGSFMAAQIVADMKYTPKYEKAPDWWYFAKSGPGSRRGLSRVMNRPAVARYREDFWWVDLNNLQKAINPLMEKQGYEKLHAQDLQNCLCEFDKYERVRLGEGRPKQLYDGG